MTIGEVAAQAGLATSAIRYYERAGLLKPAPRANGRRIYSADVLHPLLIIRFAKETGFTLPEIRFLLHGFPQNTTASARWKKMARGKIVELEAALARTQTMKKMLEAIMCCQCRTLEQCARGFARSKGKCCSPDKGTRESGGACR
jgi:MerR family redox-sensitive transcriptional activator SoxR